MNSDRGDPQTYAIIGAAMAAHGGGFLEAVYCEALAIELEERAVPFGAKRLLKSHTEIRFSRRCIEPISYALRM
jgi:hypothetical protein